MAGNLPRKRLERIALTPDAERRMPGVFDGALHERSDPCVPGTVASPNLSSLPVFRDLGESSVSGGNGVMAEAERDEADTSGDIVWLTWETHRRSREIARWLDARLLEFDIPGSRLRRYWRSVRGSVAALDGTKTRALIVQAPSVVLLMFALVWSRLHRVPLVVDAHNAAVVPEGPLAALLDPVYRGALRRASIVLVSNSNLAERVRRFGGRPMVLPDPIPEIGAQGSPADTGGEDSTRNVVVVASWASDEPLEILPGIAERLGSEVEVQVTGRPRLEDFGLSGRLPDNLKLTGYLTEGQYESLVADASVVVVLTTRPDCLVCGAYEAIGAGRPLVLSSHVALRRHFGAAAEFCDNSAASVTEAIRTVLSDRDRYAHLSRQHAIDLQASWRVSLDQLRKVLRSRTHELPVECKEARVP